MISFRHFKYFSYYKILFFLMILFFLSSCVLHNENIKIKKIDFKKNVLWNKNKKILKKLENLKVKGTIYYLNNKNIIYCKFILQQKNLFQYSILIKDPLGFYQYMINVSYDNIDFKNQHGTFYNRDIFQIKKNILNQYSSIFNLIKNLSYWIIGLPKNKSLITINNFGFLKSIKYIDKNERYFIKYLSFYKKRDIFLPKNIEIQWKKELFVLKINNWIYYS
ncbi:MAG: lipoprotein insertase outer membrane protein LolB [Arsenophonus sp.]|nr:MAG: lipoprotein insertase outer membrane protein LolB [Arsenophonus sp.]